MICATRWVCVALVISTSGCHKELLDKPLLEQYNLQKNDIYYKTDPRPLRYYKDYATGIEYPTECHLPESGVLRSFAPRTIASRRNDQVWNLSLQDAMERALAQNEIVRDDLQFRSQGNSLLANPQRTPSVYDPAIQETGVLFGNRGVEAALADFDSRLTTRLTYGRSEVQQNSSFLSLNPGDALTDETGQLTTRLEKTFADSTTFSLQHDWNRSLNNVPLTTKLFNSVYTGFIQAEIRRPLWAGAGTEFTRIAGPISNTLTGVSGVSQGVVISKINTDIAIADFELTIVNLLKNVEDRYWDLYLAYQVFDSEIEAMEDAQRNFDKVNLKSGGGVRGVGAVAVSQALKNFKDAELRVFGSLADIYEAEQRLRRLIGEQVNDGKIIRPSDEPTVAEFLPDWHMSLAEALSRRVELRRHKWNIKSLEKQLWAARRLVQPRLDVVVNYRVNGLGDNLLRGDSTAYGSIARNDNTSWTAGFDLSMPLGFRSAHSQVQNYELRLQKARKVFAFQEMDVSHELAAAFQQLDRWLFLANRNIARQATIENQIELIGIEDESGAKGNSAEAIDLIQRARIDLRDSKIAYYRSMIEYNKAITEIHYRKGTLLEHNNIRLEEGLWKAAAYKDALRRAVERSYADDAAKLEMQPIGFISRYGHPDPLPQVAPGARMPESTLTDPYLPPTSSGGVENVPEPPAIDAGETEGEGNPNDSLPEDLPTPNDIRVPEPTEPDDVVLPGTPSPRRNVTRRDTYLQRSSYTTPVRAASPTGAAKGSQFQTYGNGSYSSAKQAPAPQQRTSVPGRVSLSAPSVQRRVQPQPAIQQSKKKSPPTKTFRPVQTRPTTKTPAPRAGMVSIEAVAEQPVTAKPVTRVAKAVAPVSVSPPVSKLPAFKPVQPKMETDAPSWDDLD